MSWRKNLIIGTKVRIVCTEKLCNWCKGAEQSCCKYSVGKIGTVYKIEDKDPARLREKRFYLVKFDGGDCARSEDCLEVV